MRTRVRRGCEQETKGRDVRSTGVGVPAAFVEVESDLDDGVVVHEPPAHDPVSGHEARKVGPDMADCATVIEVREVRPVAHR